MRIEFASDDSGPVLIDGEPSQARFELSQNEEITFPAVWIDGHRQYDVEVWRDGAILATVPPRSPDVDAAFEQHEKLRG